MPAYQQCNGFLIFGIIDLYGIGAQPYYDSYVLLSLAALLCSGEMLVSRHDVWASGK